MAYPGNQKALQDLWWILCAPDGRKFLQDLIGGHAANTVLNAPIKRGGAMAGTTSLAGMVAWNDDHIIQTLAAVAASTAKGGATVEQIQAAVKGAIAESVVKVDVTVASPDGNK